MRFAIIENNSVANVTESESPLADNWKPCGEEVAIGWGHVGGEFVAPTPQEPVAPPSQRTGTHLWFRGLFTQAEREGIDELEATFDSHPLLTDEQKRQLRTGFKDYNMGTDVNKDDPRIPPMLGLFTALGLLAPGRAEEILA